MRLDVKFATTYESDLHKTFAVAIHAALGVDQVLKNPPPVCHLIAYGPPAIEYELWFWIKDPATGLTSVRTAVMLALWDTFEREGVSLPKPGSEPASSSIRRADLFLLSCPLNPYRCFR